MILRTLIVELYIVACVAAIAVDYFVPSLYLWLLGALLAWFALSFFVYRLPAMHRPVFGSSAPAPAAAAPGTAAPAPTHLGFCAYCATPIEPGTPICPACGRTIPVF